MNNAANDKPKVTRKLTQLILILVCNLPAFSYAESITDHPKAEDIVVFKQGAFACQTKEDFEKAVGHASAGEKTKFAQMFANSICIKLYDNEKYKILTKSTFSFFHASFGYAIEISNQNDFTTSFWTSTKFIDIVD
jgi:hypothetical protein